MVLATLVSFFHTAQFYIIYDVSILKIVANSPPTLHLLPWAVFFYC